MKNLIYVILLGLPFILISCNKSNSSNTATQTATTYYWNGSNCYSSPSNQQVATTFCSATSTCANTTGTNMTGTTNNGFYWNGSACYSTTTGQMVANTSCTTTANCTGANTGYTYANGYCYSTSTGQAVDYSYCNTNTNNTVVTAQCNGQYRYNGQVVNCYGNYCSGYTLIEVASGRQVRCI